MCPRTTARTHTEDALEYLKQDQQRNVKHCSNRGTMGISVLFSKWLCFLQGKSVTDQLGGNPEGTRPLSQVMYLVTWYSQGLTGHVGSPTQTCGTEPARSVGCLVCPHLPCRSERASRRCRDPQPATRRLRVPSRARLRAALAAAPPRAAVLVAAFSDSMRGSVPQLPGLRGELG